MKRKVVVISIVLILALALSGCDFFAGIFDPLIGTWKGELDEILVTLTFHGDSTFEMRMNGDFGGGTETVHASGTYKKTEDTITLDVDSSDNEEVVPEEEKQSIDYELSSDNKELTLTTEMGEFTLEKQ